MSFVFRVNSKSCQKLPSGGRRSSFAVLSGCAIFFNALSSGLISTVYSASPVYLAGCVVSSLTAVVPAYAATPKEKKSSAKAKIRKRSQSARPSKRVYAGKTSLKKGNPVAVAESQTSSSGDAQAASQAAEKVALTPHEIKKLSTDSVSSPPSVSVTNPELPKQVLTGQLGSTEESGTSGSSSTESFGPGAVVADARTGNSSQLLPTDIMKIDSLRHVQMDINGDLYREMGNGLKAYLTIDPEFQRVAEDILIKNKVPWGAIVAIEPKTGRVIALADHSANEPNSVPFSLRGGMPAASLFKVITAAAAVEEAGLSPNAMIKFRGGNYTLGERNYQPSVKLDTREMSFEKALALSCNPVFGRIGSKYLSPQVLSRYASNFGFNQRLPFELSVPSSSFESPTTPYELARTSAGFGPAMISPVHAALMAGALGNDGVMMRPRLVDRILDGSQKVVFRSRPEVLKRSISSNANQVLLKMLEETTLVGTAKKQFSKARGGALHGIPISAKTGTLSGNNPKGVYHWLVAVAPRNDPEIAIAAVVVDPGGRTVKDRRGRRVRTGGATINGTGAGRIFLERYFESRTS